MGKKVYVIGFLGHSTNVTTTLYDHMTSAQRQYLNATAL